MLGFEAQPTSDCPPPPRGSSASYFLSLTLALVISSAPEVMPEHQLACWEDTTQWLDCCRALGPWEQSLLFNTFFSQKFLLVGNIQEFPSLFCKIHSLLSHPLEWFGPLKSSKLYLALGPLKIKALPWITSFH